MNSKKQNILSSSIFLMILMLLFGCDLPRKKTKSGLRVKHNYIILLDLSDRLIVQQNQPERDKKIISLLYSIFEDNIKKDLYIKSRDEIRVVIAPQLGAGIDRDMFEDRLYVNMENIKTVYRKSQEKERRANFMANVDTLYNKAVFSKNPEDYYGADIWKYFYEDLKVDYSKDTLAENYLFILTDGYPIVGKNQVKLQGVKDEFPNLHVILVEAAPREKDMEWDHVMDIWQVWFQRIGIKKYTLIKRGAITKELEQIKEVLNNGGA